MAPDLWHCEKICEVTPYTWKLRNSRLYKHKLILQTADQTLRGRLFFHHYHERTLGGSKSDVHLFQNLKMTLFQQNHYFIGFLFVRFWGEGGGIQKVYVLYAMKMMKEQRTKLSWVLMSTITVKLMLKRLVKHWSAESTLVGNRFLCFLMNVWPISSPFIQDMHVCECSCIIKITSEHFVGKR